MMASSGKRAFHCRNSTDAVANGEREEHCRQLSSGLPRALLGRFGWRQRTLGCGGLLLLLEMLAKGLFSGLHSVLMFLQFLFGQKSCLPSIVHLPEHCYALWVGDATGLSWLF
jgi:hypothetical protein